MIPAGTESWGTDQGNKLKLQFLTWEMKWLNCSRFARNADLFFFKTHPRCWGTASEAMSPLKYPYFPSCYTQVFQLWLNSALAPAAHTLIFCIISFYSQSFLAQASKISFLSVSLFVWWHVIADSQQALQCVLVSCCLTLMFQDILGFGCTEVLTYKKDLNRATGEKNSATSKTLWQVYFQFLYSR